MLHAQLYRDEYIEPISDPSAQGQRFFVEDLLDIGIFSTMNQLLRERVVETRMKLNRFEQDLKLSDERIAIQQKYIDDVAEIQNNIGEKDSYGRPWRHQVALKKWESYQAQLRWVEELIRNHNNKSKETDWSNIEYLIKSTTVEMDFSNFSNDKGLGLPFLGEGLALDSMRFLFEMCTSSSYNIVEVVGSDYNFRRLRSRLLKIHQAALFSTTTNNNQ